MFIGGIQEIGEMCYLGQGVSEDLMGDDVDSGGIEVGDVIAG